MLGPIGMPEMIAVFVIALLLFGPKKLPELGRTLAKAISEFRRASNELKATFESHLSELEKENQSLKQSLNAYTAPDYSSSGYSYDSEYSYGSEYNQSSGSLPESSASQPSTASATATQDASANRDEQAAPPQIAGTVARSSNYAADTHHVSHEETHPA
jgi:sec-independent protein translocase protein TatA